MGISNVDRDLPLIQGKLLNLLLKYGVIKDIHVQENRNLWDTTAINVFTER